MTSSIREAFPQRRFFADSLSRFGRRLIEETKMQASGIYPGPFVALAYEQAFTKSIEKDLRLKLTFDEGTTEDFALQQGILRVLQSDPHQNFKPEHRRFSLQQIIPQAYSPQLLVLFGVSPEYFKAAYQDPVEAMYRVDEIGCKILEEGIKHDKEPWLLFSNYNFNGIEGLSAGDMRVNVNGEGLGRILDLIRADK